MTFFQEKIRQEDQIEQVTKSYFSCYNSTFMKKHLALDIGTIYCKPYLDTSDPTTNPAPR